MSAAFNFVLLQSYLHISLITIAYLYVIDAKHLFNYSDKNSIMSNILVLYGKAINILYKRYEYKLANIYRKPIRRLKSSKKCKIFAFKREEKEKNGGSNRKKKKKKKSPRASFSSTLSSILDQSEILYL